MSDAAWGAIGVVLAALVSGGFAYLGLWISGRQKTRQAATDAEAVRLDAQRESEFKHVLETIDELVERVERAETRAQRADERADRAETRVAASEQREANMRAEIARLNHRIAELEAMTA